MENGVIQLNSVQNPDFCILFEKCPGQYLVLLPDSQFTIVAVTDAYTRVTMTQRSDILYRGVFEVFPDNPDDPQASGVANLTASLNRVIHEKTHDVMAVQKYDIRRPDSEGGSFEERYWCPVNSPVLGSDNQLLYIIHRVEDVTEFIKLKQQGKEQSKMAEQMQLQSDKMQSEIFLREQALKRAHQQLRQSEELSRTLVEGIYDCIKPLTELTCKNSRESILIIEDNLDISHFLVKLLEPLYDVHTASNGQEGLEKANQLKPNLIVCELILSKISGDQILKTIRSEPATENTLFILITPNAEDVLRLQLFHEGIQDYIIKPFRKEDILARIQHLFNLKRVQDLNQMDGVLENALDCVIGVNHWGMITHWNSQSEKTFGWTKVEAIGQNMSEMIIPPSYRKLHEQGFNRFLKTGKTTSFNRRMELKGLRKDGVEFPIELSVTPMKTKDSINFYGFIRDITERIKNVEQLQHAKDQAENANFAKSSFLANMSHEIRTPLAAILGFTELLADPTIEAERKYSFNSAIKRNGELLLNLINEILDLSKVEAGKLEIDMDDCQLYELMSDVLSSLSIKASQKEIKLMSQYANGVPKIIRTDTLKLKQILLNIIGNAVKFTESGSVNVHISSVSQKNNTSLLTFTVKDTGIGISPEDRHKLFQPFSQVDTSLTRKFGGTGLGLTLSKRFAQLLGGDLILGDSTKGQGSTFIITIDPGLNKMPSKKYQGNDHDKDKHNEIISPLFSTPTTSTTPLKRIDGVKILLAEDSLDNQFLISQILKKAGAQVELVENGKIALEKAQNKHFDIFLIDIQMPVMDGYTTVIELRKKGYKTPMIALTANALQGDRERCLDEGFNEHITKPINRQALIEIIFHYCCKDKIY